MKRHVFGKNNIVLRIRWLKKNNNIRWNETFFRPSFHHLPNFFKIKPEIAARVATFISLIILYLSTKQNKLHTPSHLSFKLLSFFFFKKKSFATLKLVVNSHQKSPLNTTKVYDLSFNIKGLHLANTKSLESSRLSHKTIWKPYSEEGEELKKQVPSYTLDFKTH